MSNLSETDESLTLIETLRYLNHPPFGEVNDLNLFLFEFQSSPFVGCCFGYYPWYAIFVIT